MKNSFKHLLSALATLLVLSLSPWKSAYSQLYDYRYANAANIQYQFTDIIETKDNSGNFNGHMAIGRQRWTAVPQEGGIVLVKLDNQGNNVWNTRIRLSDGTTTSNGLYNIPTAIPLVDAAGNDAGYAIAVHMGSSATPGYTSTSFIVRVDNLGAFMWARQLRNNFAISGGTAMIIGDLMQNSAGLITYVANSRDASVTRNVCVGHFNLNGDGNQLWSRQFNSTPQYAGYSVAWDNLRIIQTHDGSYGITGRVTEYIGNWNYFRVGVMKINTDGTLNQLKYFDLNTQTPTSNDHMSLGTDIIQSDDDNDGLKDDGFAVLTNVRVDAANNQLIPGLLKLDYNFNLQWYKAYPVILNTSYGGSLDLFQEKLFDTSNEYKYIFAAQEGSHYCVITTNASGDIIPAFSKRYNPGSFSGTQTGFNVNHDKSLSLVMNNGGVGRTNSLFNLPTCYNQLALNSTISVTPWTFSSTFQRNMTWIAGNPILGLATTDNLNRIYGCAVNCNNFRVSSVTTTEDSCEPGCDGSLSIAVSGGTPSYTYNVNGVNGPASLSNLCANNYSILVTDANQCTAVSSASVNGSGSLVGSISLNSGVDQSSGAPLPLGSAEPLWQTANGAIVLTGTNPECTESQFIFDNNSTDYSYCFCLNEEAEVYIGMKISALNGPVLSSSLDGQNLFTLVGNLYGEDTSNNVPPTPWFGKLVFSGTLAAGTHCITIQYDRWHSGFAGVAICGMVESDQLLDPRCCSQEAPAQGAPKMLISNAASSAFTIYPNPANDIVFLDLKSPTGTQNHYQIIDATGRVVDTIKLPDGLSKVQIPITTLPNGLYTFRYYNGTTEETSSFIVEH